MSRDGYDVLIHGAGIAGLSAALALTEPRDGHPAPRVVVVAEPRFDAPGPGPRALVASWPAGPRAQLAARALAVVRAMASAANDRCGFVLVGSDPAVTRDAVIDADSFHALLAARVRARGIPRIDDRESADRIRPLRTVLATEATLPVDDAFSSEIAAPVRVQCMTFMPHPDRPPSVVAPLHGHALLAIGRDGRGFVREGREPSGRGDPFDRRPDPAIQARLEEFARGVVASGAPLEFDERFARAELSTCDGVPLVGPHPMRDGTLLSIGFGPDGVLLGCAAGQAIADWILEGNPTSREWLACSPRRML